MVEFALVFPVFMVMMGACFTGWAALHDAIGATGAARSGALAASVYVEACEASGPCIPAVERAQIVQAVRNEENNPAIGWIAWGAPCPSGACVQFRQLTDPTTGTQVEQVQVFLRAATEIPAFPGVLVTAEASASP